MIIYGYFINDRDIYYWRLNIWIKYISLNNWQFTIRRYVNIDKIKIQRKLKVLKILLDIYYYNQIYYWSKKMRNKIVEKCVMWLLCLSRLSWLKNPGDPNITNRSCLRLSTQVVFTAANLKTPITCLSCLAFLLCVRVWARVLWYLSALESYRKRELPIKG